MKDVRHPMFLKRSIVGIAFVESTCLRIGVCLVGISFLELLTYLNLLGPKVILLGVCVLFRVEPINIQLTFDL